MTKVGPFQELDRLGGPRLLRVNAYAERDLPNWPGVIELVFDRRSLVLVAVPEDDSLAISLRRPPEYDTPLPTGFWRRFGGKHLELVWRTVSEGGRLDGLLLQFRDRPGRGKRYLVNVVVMASHIVSRELRVTAELPRPGESATRRNPRTGPGTGRRVRAGRRSTV